MDKPHADFANRLNYALDLRSYPPLNKGRLALLQETFGISAPGAHKWLHGIVQPSRKNRKRVAETLGISLHWLETGNGNPLQMDEGTALTSNNIARQIPLLSLAEALHPEQVAQHEKREMVIIQADAPRDVIAVKQVGTSMTPQLPESAIMIVYPQAELQDGDFILAASTSLPEAIARQYVMGASGTYLCAMNPKFPPIQVNENTQILGKIMEVRMNIE